MPPFRKTFSTVHFPCATLYHSLPCYVPMRLAFVVCLSWIPSFSTFCQWEIWENNKGWPWVTHLLSLSLPIFRYSLSHHLQVLSDSHLLQLLYLGFSDCSFYMPLKIWGCNGSFTLSPKELSQFCYFFLPLPTSSFINTPSITFCLTALFEWATYFLPESW